MFRKMLHPVVVVAAFLSVPAAVLPIQSAQSQTGTTGSETNGPAAIPDEMLPTNDPIGPVGIVNELREAHSVLTDIIIDHANLNYERAENIVFTMTVVDEEEEKLNVILDPIILTLGLAYDESDIADFVEIDEAMIDVRYGIFVPDSHVSPSPQSSIDLWMSLYESRCDSTTASRLCEALAFNLGTQNHYVLNPNNRWQAPGTTPVPAPDQTTEPEPAPKPVSNPSTLPTTIFTDDFESDTFTDWTIQDRYNWEIGSFDEDADPPAHNSTNRVASADGCRAQCILALTTPLNMSSENRTALSFYRYVDQSLDSGEYLRVEVTDVDGTWTQIAEWSDDSGDDDSQWHYERLDITPYISDSFQVRFVAHMSSSSEDVAIDDVIISRVLEFYGGNNYTISFVEKNKPDGFAGTITIGVTNSSSGIKGIATAGHVIKLDNNTQRFRAHAVGNDDIVFNRNPDGYYDDIGNTDAAFVPIEDPNIIIGSKVQALNGTIMNVTHGNLLDVSRWSTVNIYGAMNNDDGWLYYRNATIYTYPSSYINMGIANYDSKEGDSGAPVIHHNASGSHNLIGIHMGGVCVFASPSELTSRMINVTLTSWCDHKKDDYWYKTFSAWENVKQVLDLQ